MGQCSSPLVTGRVVSRLGARGRHLRASSPKRSWYQQRVGLDWGRGLGERPRELEDLFLNRDLTMSLRRDTSVRSCSTSELVCGVCTAATEVGAATSMILSASCARSSRVLALGVDASTMRMLAGRH